MFGFRSESTSFLLGLPPVNLFLGALVLLGKTWKDALFEQLDRTAGGFFASTGLRGTLLFLRYIYLQQQLQAVEEPSRGPRGDSVEPSPIAVLNLHAALAQDEVWCS